jgi:hypothetical protein
MIREVAKWLGKGTEARSERGMAKTEEVKWWSGVCLGQVETLLREDLNALKGVQILVLLEVIWSGWKELEQKYFISGWLPVAARVT